jgi:DNA-binding transcriptional LysR family regulator
VDWNDLRYFLKVAETGGLTPAARFLRVNAATVARHIEALEAGLGQRLFERAARGYRLTDAGERLFEWARKVECEFNDIQAAFGAALTETAGIVSVAATDWIASGLLIPTLPEFRRRHPGIDLVIVSRPEPMIPSRGEADIALCLFHPERGNLEVRCIADIGHALYASADYVERHGRPDAGGAATATP